MNNTDHKQKKVKFPRIKTKPKSMPEQISTSSIVNQISAKSWLYNTPNSQYGFKSNMKREIASLTKIMTCLCTIELCQKYSMKLQTTFFKVTQWAAKTNGTSANLIENAWLSIEDLLYGLMLPSGNDAAVVLAENIGAVLYFDKSGNKSLIQEIRSIDLTEDKQSVKYYTYEFIDYMNEKALKLKMFTTRFSNPHGLDSFNHYSCCDDVLLMSKQAIKDQKIRKIIGTQTYKGNFKFFKDGKVICKPAFWTNTNKLLGNKNIFGIKTGITSKAGGCLSTSFINKYGEEGIVIVLGCTSTEERFKDTSTIINWGDQEGI